jgi:hypothetical protein
MFCSEDQVFILRIWRTILNKLCGLEADIFNVTARGMYNYRYA